jgi:prepilin-type N-terminal cleavage/methylation domain-containing protein/prepilin-type processing-associated H-X9-DG protein
MNLAFPSFRGPRPNRGFTLIEVLVVVAIIALLVAILLPSLQRAREQTRSVMCQAHLKEFGHAMSMYLMDFKDRLPGPVHPAMLKYVHNTSEAQKRFYLPTLLRRYFSSSAGSGAMADAIASCPSFPVADSAFPLSVWGVDNNPFHYTLNSWTNTKPEQYYFGFTHAGIADFTAWYNTYCNTSARCNLYGPKRWSRVNLPAKEYAIADAFMRPFWESAASGLPRGSWPREDESTGNSGGTSTIRRLPLSPYHLGTGWEQRGATWEYKGRTNILFFDWHVESVRSFPRFHFNRDPGQL